MGDVYVVRHAVYGSTAALKVLHAELTDDPDWRLRFDEEALVGQRLKHPYVVAARELVVCDRRVGLVMDLVPGARSLARMIETGHRGGLPTELALRLFLSIVEAVEYAHDHGVVHGDLKPENILIDGDLREPGAWTPRVCDFGTVALIAKPVLLEGRPAVVASPRYASPEHLLGVSELRMSSDLFALGLVLSFILTGRHLSPARSVEEAAVWLSGDGGVVDLVDLPATVRALVGACTARDPAARPASIRDLALRVRRSLDDLGCNVVLEDVGADVATELVDRDPVQLLDAEVLAEDATAVAYLDEETQRAETAVAVESPAVACGDPERVLSAIVEEVSDTPAFSLDAQPPATRSRLRWGLVAMAMAVTVAALGWLTL
jgi:serine/threonine protein kinase